MTALLTNEFYEHLYKLEERKTLAESWITRVDEEDPDLLWCQRFIQKALCPEWNRETFAETILKCFQEGDDNTVKIGRCLKIHHTTVEKRLRDFDLIDFYESLKTLYHGVVMQRSEDGQSWFMRNRQVGAEFIGYGDRRNLGHMITHKVEKRGFMAYEIREWRELHPEFSLPLEEVLKNEIIRIDN